MAMREEKGTTIPWLGEAGEQGAVLDGLFIAGQTPSHGGAVIAPPHPLYGGSMDSPVVSELAWACTKAGLASLRFDWRGVGASAGEPSGDLGVGAEDFAAALLHMGRTVSGPLLAAGYSFGAGTALRAADGQPRVSRLLLVAPPPSLLDVAALARGEREILILAGERDALAPADALAALAESAPRTRFVPLPEADHFFGVGLAQLTAAVTHWLDPKAAGV
jgi:alpha/beta superfamily hydrolase